MMRPFTDIPKFFDDPLTFLTRRVEASTGPFTPLWLGLRPIHLLCDGAHVRDILLVSEERFRKGALNDRLKVMIGESIVTATGEVAKTRRRILHDHFRMERIQALSGKIAAVTTRSVAEAAGRGRVSLPRFTAVLAFRIACMVLLAEQLLDDAEETRLFEALSGIEHELSKRIWRLWPVAPWVRKAEDRRFAAYQAEFDDLVGRVIERSGPDSVVRTLRNAGLQRGEIRDEILTLLVAGHETTASAAAWLLHELAKRPDLQAVIAREGDEASDDLGEIPAKNMRLLKHSAAAVNETLRCYPSVWTFSREATRDTEIGGYRIRRGESVIVSSYALQHDARNWDVPFEFRVDRDPAAYRATFPFGAGPRACLGSVLAVFELQMIATAFCNAFDLRPADAGLDAKPVPAVTLLPDPRLEITISPRERSLQATRVAA